MAQAVWQNMDKGGFSPVLREDLLRFNGGLFADTQALKLTGNQLELLIEAAKQDWSDVEPAIFGTLLERALDPTERHKLGAHYTPRAYVERLVLPTVIEPLRDDWHCAQNAAIQLANKGNIKQAIAIVGKFLKDLCSVIILDPACGSGNFLYVTLEHLKRLEGEVHDFLFKFPNTQLPLEYTGLTVDPHQLRGIEINPRAAAITDLVLWIGYLQWHFRTHGNTMPAEPVLKKFDNIECRDAVLAYDKKELARDEQGKPLSRWNGVTTKKSSITGEEIPDDSARVAIYTYTNPRKAEWPKADFVVGNPPFIGPAPMRAALGDGYVDSLRATYDDLPESIDFVMYWWNNAAQLCRKHSIQQFGFITTNGIRQTFNRRVVSEHMLAPDRVSITFAIPDHPWVDSAGGAAVRIAMTVAAPGELTGSLQEVSRESPSDNDEVSIELISRTGIIHADLTIGAAVVDAKSLRSNLGISCRGMSLHGAGFIVTPEEARDLGLGRTKALEKHIRPYLNGRDLNQKSRGLMVIDLLGLSADDVRKRFPEVYQRIFDRVKPERDENNRPSYRDKWWIFGEARSEFRPALENLKRYIATVETSRHRFFTFLDANTIPDNKLVSVATDDAYILGVLSSLPHVTWAIAAGGWLGAGNDPVYVKTKCFETFPFPDCTAAQKQKIRTTAEELDAHRKRQQQKFPDLTLTDMYNILEKLRDIDAGTLTAADFSPKDKQIHDRGLVSILKQLHDELDAAVFDAYGWPPTLTDDQLLEKLVALNHKRHAEEQGGLIRYLRPDFQAASDVV